MRADQGEAANDAPIPARVRTGTSRVQQQAGFDDENTQTTPRPTRDVNPRIPKNGYAYFGPCTGTPANAAKTNLGEQLKH